MSWFRNLFKKKKSQRLPARDHTGRFMHDDQGKMLYNDAPQEQIAKARLRALQHDIDRTQMAIDLAIQKKRANSSCKCGGNCKCGEKKVDLTKKPAPKKK